MRSTSTGQLAQPSPAFQPTTQWGSPGSQFLLARVAFSLLPSFLRNRQACSGETCRWSCRSSGQKAIRAPVSTTGKRKAVSPTARSNGFQKNWLSGLPEISGTVQLEVYRPWNVLLQCQSKRYTVCVPTVSFAGVLRLDLCPLLGHSFFQCPFFSKSTCQAKFKCIQETSSEWWSVRVCGAIAITPVCRSWVNVYETEELKW